MRSPHLNTELAMLVELATVISTPRDKLASGFYHGLDSFDKCYIITGWLQPAVFFIVPQQMMIYFTFLKFLRSNLLLCDADCQCLFIPY